MIIGACACMYVRIQYAYSVWSPSNSSPTPRKTASIKTMFSNNIDEVGFDYCIICSGCNFGPFKPMGESLWFPTVHEEARGHSDWKHIDERYLEGRRRHVLEEYQKLTDLNKKQACFGDQTAPVLVSVLDLSSMGEKLYHHDIPRRSMYATFAYIGVVWGSM